MPKQTKFKPVSTAEGWRINVPSRFTESGKRERYFYKTRELANEAAQGFREKRDNHGANAKTISPSLAEQAAAAAKLLEPFGISLLESARRTAEEETRKQGSVTVENAAAQFTAAKEGLSVKQRQAIRHACTHLVEDFAGRLLATIRGEEIAEHLGQRTNGATSFNGRLRILKTLWRWSAKPMRSWCDGEALKHIEKQTVTGSEIGTLTAAECRALLEAAEKHHPDAVLGFALALFTGIRQAELERLLPEHITLEGINLPALKTKSNRRRFIEMPPPLAAWIEAYPVGESVLASNWSRKERAVRRLAGFRVWSDLIDPPEAPEKLPAWPQNALRHTAASAALAMGKPVEALVFEHGHTEGITTLKSHYLGRMTKKDALLIWSMGPHGTKLSNIAAA